MVYGTEVQPLGEHWLRVTFTDGAVKEIDLSELLASGGVFAPIYERRQLFEQVRVNPENGAVEWPGDVDLDPEVLYGPWTPRCCTAASSLLPGTTSPAARSTGQ